MTLTNILLTFSADICIVVAESESSERQWRLVVVLFYFAPLVSVQCSVRAELWLHGSSEMNESAKLRLG